MLLKKKKKKLLFNHHDQGHKTKNLELLTEASQPCFLGLGTCFFNFLPINTQKSEDGINSRGFPLIRQLERRTFRLLLRYSSYPTQIRFHVKASCTDRFKTFDGGLTINEKKKSFVPDRKILVPQRMARRMIPGLLCPAKARKFRRLWKRR